jgi:hypothetical protein
MSGPFEAEEVKSKVMDIKELTCRVSPGPSSSHIGGIRPLRHCRTASCCSVAFSRKEQGSRFVRGADSPHKGPEA